MSIDNGMQSSKRHAIEELLAPIEALKGYSDDVKYLWCPHSVPILEHPPSSMFFLRNHVAKSVPCIIRNAMMTQVTSSWHVSHNLSLTLDDLVDICHDQCQGQIVLTVDVTPDGHGDCVRTVKLGDTHHKRMFVKPQERKMMITEFRDKVRLGRLASDCTRVVDMDENGRAVFSLGQSDRRKRLGATISSPDDSDTVLYYSRQNDCLRTELRPLFECGLFPETIDFAEEAFGVGPPDAVNLWIGDERSVSSMHKDHYENLFYVLSGEKAFTLCPPADAPFLYQGDFDSGAFCQKNNGEWIVRQEYADNEDENQTGKGPMPSRVKWIEGDVEPLVTDGNDGIREDHPLLSLTHPIKVHVKAGEMLYLPALWFHRVTQTLETVGVNYWYDMHFDSPHWCYFNFLQQLEVHTSSKASLEEN